MNRVLRSPATMLAFLQGLGATSHVRVQRAQSGPTETPEQAHARRVALDQADARKRAVRRRAEEAQSEREIERRAKDVKRAQKRRRDALRSIRGREEPGHPGCSCGGPHTAYETNPRGHRSDCIAWRTAFSREDQLEALYGSKL